MTTENKSVDVLLSSRPWVSFGLTDILPVKALDVALTAEHFHTPIGLDRDAIFFDPVALALAALTIGCNAVSLSTYRGEVTRYEYGVFSLDGARPHLSNAVRRARGSFIGWFQLRRFDEVEGFDDPISQLDIMVNSDEAQQQINGANGSLTSPRDWAAITNGVVEASLRSSTQGLPRKNQKYMRGLLNKVNFITARD